jgi:hypothetical protein
VTSEHATATAQARAAFDYINRDGWTVCAVGADKKALGSWSAGGPNRYDYRNAERVFGLSATAYGCIAGPSNVVIVDLDNADAIRAFAERFGIPDTRIANTPRGKHLYYQAPADVQLRPSVSIMPGVDVRAGESYAIIPPSTTTGGEYSWANDKPIAPMPPDLLAALTERTREDKDRVPDGEPIPEGRRNDELWNRALRLVRAGLSHIAVVAAVTAEAEAYAEGVMTVDEIVDICRSARLYHERHGAADEQTIEEVVAGIDAVGAPELGASLELLDVRQMMLTEPPAIDWLWGDYLARGTLNLLHGDAGLGKSMISLAIASHCTIGTELLSRPTTVCDVAFIDAENAQSEIHRRIRTAYDRVSNVDRLHYFRADDAILGQREKTAQLFAWIQRETGASLYILDSQRALWHGDEKEQAEVGRMLRYLARIAEALDICILTIHHDTKAGAYSGSSDISAALTGSRLHLRRAAKKDDPDADGWSERHLVHAKCRIGAEQPVEQFRIEMAPGIDLVRSGPTSDLEFLTKRIIAFAAEHEAWPTIPLAHLHDEFDELSNDRTWRYTKAHMKAMGLIDHEPKRGQKTITFVSQSSV